MRHDQCFYLIIPGPVTSVHVNDILPIGWMNLCSSLRLAVTQRSTRRTNEISTWAGLGRHHIHDAVPCRLNLFLPMI